MVESSADGTGDELAADGLFSVEFGRWVRNPADSLVRK